MLVNINNQDIAVKFQHIQNDELRATKCIIVDGKVSRDSADTDFIGVGYAKVHPKDNFCKEKGRRIALTRALEDAGYTKDQKKVFWENYATWGIQRF